MIARRLVIRGRVQGVGYREAMVAAAREVGAVGWVRNLRDGAVEALVQGDPEAVERVVAWCRRGPPVARVTEVIAEPAPVEAHDEFLRRPSG
jgi:acylphosphatase